MFKMDRNQFLIRLCTLIVFKILFSFADVFSDLSTGKIDTNVFFLSGETISHLLPINGAGIMSTESFFSGLELGGLDPPMKYLAQPITNYLNGFTRQSIADENDALLNNQLNVLEKLNVQFCKELKFSILQLRTRDSKNWGTILSTKKETIVNETKHSGKMI